MNDLRVATDNLRGHTLCLCKDLECLTSDKRGIAPIMDFIRTGKDIRGYSVADVVVGKAVALLFVRSGIKAVYAKTLSESGKKILDEYGVYYEYERLTERIINRAGTDVCPMEKALKDIDDPEEAYKKLLEVT